MRCCPSFGVFSHLTATACVGEPIGFFVTSVVGVSLNPLPCDVACGSKSPVDLLTFPCKFKVSFVGALQLPVKCPPRTVSRSAQLPFSVCGLVLPRLAKVALLRSP